MYHKVLVPVVPSDDSEMAWQSTRHAVHICDGEIILFNVFTPVAYTLGGEQRMEVKARLEAAARKVVDGAIKIFATELASSDRLKFRGKVAEGSDIVKCILQAAEEESVDAIVMLTNGRNNLGEYLLGSTTERVIRKTAIPVVVIHRNSK